MNHIYKVIWNTITQTWVAVSELSRAKGKTKSSKTLSAVVLAAVSAGAIVGDAEAATNFVQNQTGIAITRSGGDAPATASDRWAIAVGDSAKANSEYSIAVGGHTNATGESAIAIGKQTKVEGQGATAVGRVTLASAQYSSAYGAQAKATGNQSTALGYVANAAASNSLAAGALAQAQGESSVALGRDAQAWGSGASAVGEGSRANNSNAFAGGNGAQATGSWATAVGPSTLASGEASAAYGDGSEATGKKSIATGSHASASAENAIAIGNSTKAQANNTIAIGNDTKATDKSENSLVIGQGAVVTAKDATVVGPVAQANGENATAVGRGAAANGTESTALGRGSVATGNQSIALGKGANAKVDSGVALGDDSVADRTARSQNGIVINTSDPSKSTGFNTENSVYAPVRLVDTPEALNLIKNTIKGNKGAVSVGDSGNTRQIINVAAGSADSDAVNVAQLKAVAGAIKHYDVVSPNGDITVTHPDPHDPNKTVWNLNLNPDRVKEITKWKLRDVEENGNPEAGKTDALVKGDETVTFQDTDTIEVERVGTDGKTLKFHTKKNIKYFSVNSSKGGNENNDGATVIDAIAIGKDASSTGSSAVSLGLGAKALGANNTAIGPGAQAKDVRTTAIGYNANASEASAVSIGYAANAAKSRSLAIGQDATASANNAIALGSSRQHGENKTTASAEHAVAIGSGAEANIANGIALGSESKTTATSASGQSGFDASQDVEGARTNKYNNLKNNVQNVRTSTLAGLSIGDTGKTRQINHLAAGTADDDAVNVAQLKSVNLAFKGDNNTKGDVRLHDQRLSVVGATNDFITTKASDSKLEIGTKQGTFSTTDGKSSSPKQGLATTTDVANAINASGWKVQAKGTTVGLVNPGDKVNFTNADKSIEIEYSAEASGLSTIKFKAVTAEINTEKKHPVEITVDDKGIATPKIDETKQATPTGRFVVPTGDATNKYALATAYDVADKVNQTGWNLYNNGRTPALINPGDYVNFQSGNATKAKVVTQASEGATISYDVNVDNTTIKIDSDGNKLTANTGDVDSVTNIEGNSKKGQVTIHKDPLEPSKTDAGKLATVDTVVKAVNNAKWFTIAKDSDDKVTGETKTNESEGTAMAAGETLGLNAGKNLRLKREANTNNFTFALDSNLKDLDSVHTKEIKLGESNNPISIKNDGDRITYTTKGGDNSDVTHKVANLEDEKHIKPTTDGNEYTVDASGNITMTYADGNNKDVTNTKAVIKGVAKNDLSNITNDGKKAITTLGSVVKAGDNVLVDEDTDAVTGKKTYTVNAVTPVVYTDKKGNRVYKFKKDGVEKFYTKPNGEGEEVTNKDEIIASFYDANNSTTAGAMIVNNIGSAIKNATVPAGKDANNFLNKLEVAASDTGTQNAAVNVSDLHNTADALRSNEIHIAPTKDAEGQNPATHYTYNAATKQVEMTYEDGKGNRVANKKAVIDLSSLADSVHNYGFKANATGHLETGSTAAETEVENGKTVNFDAGKNLTVTQTVDGTSKNHTYSFALKDDVVIGAKGENGKDGIDGSIGVNGKDGSAVAINGKDGSIGLNGKNGENGLTIKGAQGPSGVDGKDGKDGKESTTMTRIVYETPKDAGSTETIKHEVATLDDGVKYAGDDAQPGEGQTEHQKDKVIAKKLNNIIDIIGGADKNKLSDKNIGVNNVDGKLKVQLAKELKGLTSAAVSYTHLGITIKPANSNDDSKTVSLTNTGLNNGGNTITNVAEGKKGTDAVNVNQLNKVEAKITEGGLTFAGNSGIAHKAKLNTTVNIKGGEDNTDTTKFDNGKNVMTAVNGDTVTVSIKKTPEVEGINITDTTGKVKVKLTQTDEGLKVSDGNDKETRITNVAEGKNGTDAVNVKQLNSAKTEVTAGDNIDVTSSKGANGQTIYKVSAKGINDTSAAVEAGSDHVKVTKADKTRKDGSTTVTDYTVDLSDETKNTIRDTHNKVTNEGLTFNADTGSTGVKKLGSKVAVNGDGKNITTTADENGVKVSMKDDIKVNSVTAAKEVKVGNVKINENGIHAGDKRITNVAPGKDGTDAVNVNQLKYVAGNISNQINNVDKGLRAGIAGALASGGLYHVTTAGKSMVSVGAGTYRGQNALAVGYSRLSDNGKVGVKFTVNSNSQGHAGASASVGYQW
ncbi:ESPR-type extended signal peptide-containing protein [Haemophilus haemolyticus]|uniref:ESPR-type extended signal peptide-containing protein n=1 Tax=Haemophilus haemolyticus TaxID=726 RepID=UPI0011283898|nr:ESPR-type extended signal peptide-containing protein [Haemophilus haemolyticus]TPH04880.1 hypothetical protein EUX51_01015 [Haemophilus haemolyticus]